MKIVRLVASNLMRLQAIDITPDGNVVIVSGKNGQGKTSVLNTLWAALEGAKFGKANPRPVRDGEEHARVELDFGDIVVTRTWTADGRSTLKVTNGLGIDYKSPQKLLDGLVGKLSFDPLAFAGLKPADQVAQLLDLIDLPFDPIELDAEHDRIYAARTVVGREVRSATAQYEALPEIDDDVPDEELSMSDLLAEIEASRQVDLTADRARARLDRANLAVETRVTQIEHLERQLAEARETLAQDQEAAAALAVEVDQAEALVVDVTAQVEALADIEQVNMKVREKMSRQRFAARIQDQQSQWDGMTRQLDEIAQRKADALAAANMPIEGLGFGDGGVTYRDVPFSQASSAEQLRVSMAMAGALNPDIRVVRVTDGSLLDSDSMALVTEMADEMDLQVWIECVADDVTEVGFFIEDGEVTAQNGDPV